MFQLTARERLPVGSGRDLVEVRTGDLECEKCRARFPILAGVAVVVGDVREYLLTHVKGVSKLVAASEVPKEWQREFREAEAELAGIGVEHIEEDLEAGRVIALYFMNHYLRAQPVPAEPWWRPRRGAASPLIDALVREHWDKGPFARIERWVGALARAREGGSAGDLVELGCGVGGLYPMLRPHLRGYLGVDISFAAIALGRHAALGMPYAGKIGIPEDLLAGTASRPVEPPRAPECDGSADLVVGDFEAPPLAEGAWDVSVALNAIDMLESPSILPELQYSLLKKDGAAIQGCPYIWHEGVARKLRGALPREIRDSARAVEWLYERAGLKVVEAVDHLPWLFFKHARQMEVYSAHLFRAARER